MQKSRLNALVRITPALFGFMFAKAVTQDDQLRLALSVVFSLVGFGIGYLIAKRIEVKSDKYHLAVFGIILAVILGVFVLIQVLQA